MRKTLRFFNKGAAVQELQAILNILPIPVLDGGHLFLYLIEAVKGSPVSQKFQLISFQIGFFVVAGIMLLALYNDIMRY